MTKIKNFRITLRPREIARWIKTQKQIPTTPNLESAVQQAIDAVKGRIKPAAIYTTLTRATADKTTSLPLPAEAVAVSIIAVTLSDGLSRAQGIDGLGVDGLDAAAWLEAIEQEALQQSVQFAMRLLQEQAKDESCQLSAPLPAPDAEHVPSLAALLGVHRIGIVVESADALWPTHARLVWSFWTPAGKSTGERRETPVRSPEKAAV